MIVTFSSCVFAGQPQNIVESDVTRCIGSSAQKKGRIYSYDQLIFLKKGIKEIA